MQKPILNEIEIPADVDRQFPSCAVQLAPQGFRTVTMSEDQWDGLLQAAYDAGWTLLELDESERLIHIYCLPMS